MKKFVRELTNILLNEIKPVLPKEEYLFGNIGLSNSEGFNRGIRTAISIINNFVETYDNGWIVLTDDEESYPECFEYVLVEDDIGDKFVACCDPNYEWSITNGENSLKLIGNVVKWKKIFD